MENMRFKVGDRVQIKSLDWYNENKDSNGDVPCDCDTLFLTENKKYLGTTQTVETVYKCEGRYIGNHIYKLKGIESTDWTDEMIEGLVEPEPKFKVGDRVKWYNYTCHITSINTNESTHIYLIKHDDYREDKIFAKWVPESELTFEDDEETKPNIIEEAKTYWNSIKDAWICPDGYIFKDERGNIINATKIVLEKKKKEYPKTYEECCEIVHSDPKFYVDTHLYSGILETLYKLLICRDAYWQIAGENMKLGKPWEPSKDKMVYSFYRHSNKIETDIFSGESATFEFPTAEMRDAFYENFKEEIEICKELL